LRLVTTDTRASFGLFSPEGTSRAAGRIRVLVVDDDECLREMMRLRLSQAGYSVRVAADAIEGGCEVLENVPDVMIVDADMPHLNGVDFVAAVRADPLIPYFPVISLSKPLRADRLLDAVDAATRARRIQAVA
jgi:DNA-binding response OmpR family regulator